MNTRDWAMPEVHFANLGLNYVSTDCTFKSICVSDRRKLNFPTKNDNPNKNIVSKTIRDFYASRLTGFHTKECIDVYESVHKLKNMNFITFATLFETGLNNTLKPAKRSRNFVLKAWPTYPPHAKGLNYAKHCKYELIKYKPWKKQSNTLLTEFQELPDHKDSKELELFQHAYEKFLLTPEAKLAIPNFENELKNAL
jgi:hypothetical protein